MTDKPEVYISVDIEAAGPNPGRYSLLSIGACRVDDPTAGFYVELQPTSDEVDEHALSISGLSMDTLREQGHPPAQAMAMFAEWIEEVTPEGSVPILVGQNVPFDWMFLNEWFHTFLGRNPFGHSAIDIKSLAMGRDGCTWADTSIGRLATRYGSQASLTHHALDDARVQADLFNRVRGAV